MYQLSTLSTQHAVGSKNSPLHGVRYINSYNSTFSVTHTGNNFENGTLLEIE
jgi:hypothetical protein